MLFHNTKVLTVYSRYEARVLVDEEEWGFSAADSRKAAKQEAARIALSNLHEYSEVIIYVYVLVR